MEEKNILYSLLNKALPSFDEEVDVSKAETIDSFLNEYYITIFDMGIGMKSLEQYTLTKKLTSIVDTQTKNFNKWYNNQKRNVRDVRYNSISNLHDLLPIPILDHVWVLPPKKQVLKDLLHIMESEASKGGKSIDVIKDEIEEIITIAIDYLEKDIQIQFPYKRKKIEIVVKELKYIHENFVDSE